MGAWLSRPEFQHRPPCRFPIEQGRASAATLSHHGQNGSCHPGNDGYKHEQQRVEFIIIVADHTDRRPRESKTAPSDDGVGYGIRVFDFDRKADTRLAVYGSLAPGRVNHHQLADLKGRWQRGTVQGKLTDAGWGSALGFPGLILDPAGPAVEVYLFESLELRDHWPRLDKFEGPDYRRVVTPVRLADGEVGANIYVVGP